MSYVCYSVNITAYHQHYSSGIPSVASSGIPSVECRGIQVLHDPQDPKMVPALGMLSPFQHGLLLLLLRPRRRSGAVSGAAKVYMTRKTQRLFRRWGCSRPSNTASSSSVPGAAGASYSPVPGAVSGAASGGAVGDAGGGCDARLSRPGACGV